LNATQASAPKPPAPEDQNHRRADEAQPADDHAGHAGDASGAEHRELGRGGARKQIAGRDRVFHLSRRHPAALGHHQLLQQRDVRRRTTEAGDADPAPLERDGPQWDASRHGHARYRSFSDIMLCERTWT
jgi:hypothetical protein